jgi:hypothetical protein
MKPTFSAVQRGNLQRWEPLNSRTDGIDARFADRPVYMPHNAAKGFLADRINDPEFGAVRAEIEARLNDDRNRGASSSGNRTATAKWRSSRRLRSSRSATTR